MELSPLILLRRGQLAVGQTVTIRFGVVPERFGREFTITAIEGEVHLTSGPDGISFWVGLGDVEAILS